MKYEHKQAVDLFLEMAQVDSPSYSEKNMVDYLLKLIEKLGWDCITERIPVVMSKMKEEDKCRFTEEELKIITEQLVVTIPATDPTRKSIYLCAHIDTVMPGLNIKPILTADNKIVTDGSTILGSDDKSGVASIVTAVDEIIREKIPHGKICLFFTALEEKGHIGADQIDIEKYGVDYGYVFDTVGNIGRMVVRAQHSQSIECTVTVSNLPNHAYACTVPNSLVYACDLIAQIEKGLFDKDDMTFTQVIKLDNSYDAGYMAPYKSVFKLTVRSFDQKVQQANVKKITDLFDSFNHENATLTYTFAPKKTLGYNHKLHEQDQAIMDKATQIISDMGIKPEYITMGLGGHDASSFIMKGAQSLVLSCGMQEIHTVKEWIDVNDLHNCAELIRRLIINA